MKIGKGSQATNEINYNKKINAEKRDETLFLTDRFRLQVDASKRILQHAFVGWFASAYTQDKTRTNRVLVTAQDLPDTGFDTRPPSQTVPSLCTASLQKVEDSSVLLPV